MVTASPQNLAGMPFALSMLLAMATTVWFHLSTTPFCWGVYGVVSCRLTPSSAQYSMNTADVNSPPRSVRRARRGRPVSTSTVALKRLIAA